MRKKALSTLSLVLATVFSLCLLTACGGGQSSGGQSGGSDAQTAQPGSDPEELSVVGAWDDDEGGVSLDIYDDGTLTVSSFAFIWDGTYTWDGETLELQVSESSMTGSGYLDEDGDLVVDGSVFVSVDEAYYTPSALLAGSQADLEGHWVHTSDYLFLDFDGAGDVAFSNDMTGESGVGHYGFDGEDLVIATLDEDGEMVLYHGEMDSFGDVVIDLWDGEGGWYELE